MLRIGKHYGLHLNTTFQKCLLWLSQYQITLILITAVSMAAGGWLFQEGFSILTGISIIPWFFHDPLPLMQNSKLATTVMLLLSGFLMAHLLCLAWIRTARNLSNAPLIAFLTLLSLYLPATIVNHWFSQHYRSDTTVGNVHYFLDSVEEMEVVLVTDHPQLDRLGVFTIPFKALKEKQQISHSKWNFTLTPEILITHAGIGGPQSRLLDSKGNELRGIQASEGISNDKGLRLYKVTPTEETGKGLIIRVASTQKEKAASYLLYGSHESGKALPPQALGLDSSNRSISLLPRRIYPGFSWKVMRSNDTQWLVILDADGKHETGRFPLGLKSHPTVKGYTFTPIAPSGTGLTANSINIKISYTALPLPYEGIRALLILTLFTFLTVRVLQEGIRSTKRRVQA